MTQRDEPGAPGSPSSPGAPDPHAPAAARGDGEVTVIASRYELREALGDGGAGSVHRAFDRQARGEVAIKLLREELARKETHRLRFLREFRAIARLDHPNCLRVFEEGRDGARLFYTMPIVEHGDLEGAGALDEATRLSFLYQIADALDHIHAQRIVHRDLKPANILLDGAPRRPLLADFGLARALDEGRGLTQTGALLGTVTYMAPEQISSRPIDARADLYALGCIIHFLWAGSPPFPLVGSPFLVMRAHLEEPPPRLSDRVEGVPEALDALTWALLAKDPAARPQRAAEIKAALAPLLTDSMQGAAPTPTTPRRRVLYRSPMVGREAVRRDALAALVAMARPGADALDAAPPTLVALCAPAGLGKSCLLDVLAGDLAARELTLLRVSVPAGGVGAEPFAPFPALEAALEALGAPSPPRAALDEALRRTQATPSVQQPRAQTGAARRTQAAPAVQRDDAATLTGDEPFSAPTQDLPVDPTGATHRLRVDALPASARDDGLYDDALTIEDTRPLPMPQAPPGALAGELPVGAAVVDAQARRSTGERLLPIDPDAARRQRVARFAQALRARHARQPLALLIEDLHDLDDGAERYLGDLLDQLRARRPRPALLVTLRPGAQRERLSRRGDVRFIDLQPLGEEDTRRMVGVMLGCEPDALNPTSLAHLLAQTEGNPLFVQSYLQALADEHRLEALRRGATPSRVEDLRVELPRSMAQILRDRLRLLAPETQKALQIAALIGRRFDFALLREVSGAPLEALLDAIDEGLRAWIIQSVDGPAHLDVYEFDHIKLVDVLLEGLSPSRRRALHDAAGAALTARADTSAAALAHHFSRGADRDLAIHHLRRAAEETRAAADLAATCRLLERALSLHDTPPAELVEAHARALIDHGRFEAAASALRPILEADAEPATQASRRRLLARALFLSGQTEASLEAYQRALRLLGDSAPPPGWRARLRIAWELLITALAVIYAPRQRTPRLEALATIHREMALFVRWRNLEQAAVHYLRHVNLARRLDDPDHLSEASSALAVVYNTLSLERASRRAIRRALALSADPAANPSAARVRAYAAIAFTLNNRLAEGGRMLDEAFRLVQASGDRVLRGFVSSIGCWSLALLNRWPEGHRRFIEARELGREVGDPRLTADSDLGAMCIGLYTGQSHGDDARARLDEAQRVGEQLALPCLCALADEARGGLALFAEDTALACACFERASVLYARHKLFGAWGFLVHYHHLEALLWAIDLGHRPAAEVMPELARVARASSRSLRGESFRAMRLLVRGVLAARQGREGRARRLLARAHEATLHPAHVFTGLVTQRALIERARFGDDPARLLPELDRTIALFEAAEVYGLARWVRRARAHVTGQP